MAKSKTKTNEFNASADEFITKIIGKKAERDFTILEASIKDDFCNYQFEVTHGVGIGDRHGVKGSGFVKDSLKEALAELNVHFAIIDDVFKNAGVDKDINELKTHESTYLYAVSGFKIKNDTISITASKYLSIDQNRRHIKIHFLLYSIKLLTGLKITINDLQRPFSELQKLCNTKSTINYCGYPLQPGE